MGGRTRRPTTPPEPLGTDLLATLRAVAEARVSRDDCNGQRRGMWALHRLDARNVGISVRTLARYGFVHAPLLGPPVITSDGLAYLRLSG